MKFTVEQLDFLIDYVTNCEHKDKELMKRKLESMRRTTINNNTRAERMKSNANLDLLASMARQKSVDPMIVGNMHDVVNTLEGLSDLAKSTLHDMVEKL